MAIPMANLRRIHAVSPPRTLIYGPPGMGKTTLASEWPDAVFLQIEDGTPGDMKSGLISWRVDDGTENGRPPISYDEVVTAMSSLYTDDHDLKSVVVDSLDKLEPLIWAKACADNNWQNIESPGYGRGYVAADAYWRDLIEGMNALRRDKNMNIVYIAHSTVMTAPDPVTVEYSQFNIRLHKRALGIFQDEVDAILFLNQGVTIKADDPKDKQSRVRADGGGVRWIYASPHPAFVAKNRYGIPDKLMYERGKGYAALAPHFPGQVPSGKQQSAA